MSSPSNMRAIPCPVSSSAGSSVQISRSHWRGLVPTLNARWTRLSLGWLAACAGPVAMMAALLPSPTSTNPPAATITANALNTATLLTNGGAESTTGWTFTGAAALAVNGSPFVVNNPPAPQGTSVVRIQFTGTATLAVNLPAAGSYRLRLLAAQRKQGTTDNAQVLEVTVGVNKQVDHFQPPSSNYTERVTRPFSMPAGATTIKFSGLNLNGGDNTALIDRIRLEPVREWNDATSWTPARVPLATDNVLIPVGRTIAMKGDCVAATTNVEGQLLATTFNATLTTRWVLVRGLGAVFEVGRKNSPYLQNFTLTLTGNDGATENILDAGSKFLMAEMEGLIYLHGDNDPLRRSWTQLGATPQDNSRIITLKEAVNWKADDKIVIASSNMWEEAEEHTVESVTGNQVTLKEALAFRHLGVAPQTYSRTTGTPKTWTLDQRAEVGLLTRNIVIEGDAASETNGFGGHIMVMWCASCGSSGEAYIDGVELRRMGQKQRLGRYPMHWHMLGAEGIDQYFTNSSIHHTYNRALTIHGTWSTLVNNNVMYNHIGHGLFLENGSEIDNVITNNLVMSTIAPLPGEEVTPSDNEFQAVQNASPASYWITNPRNTFVNNVAAGTEGTGFWFIFPTTPLAPSGTDARFSAMEPYKTALTEFRGNRAHSCRSGIDLNDQLTQAHSIEVNGAWEIPASNPAIIQDFSAYSIRNAALYAGVGNSSANVIYDNAVLADNRDNVFFATYQIVRDSLIVADSGNGLTYFPPEVGPLRYAYRTYDGAGQMENCHLVGYDDTETTLVGTFGAANKHPNHRFRGLTFDGAPRVEFPNANVTGGQGDSRLWGSVIRDETGSVTGFADYSIVSNHRMLRTPGDGTFPSWVNAFYTSAHFCFLRISYNMTDVTKPAITVVRKHAGQADETWDNNNDTEPHHQMAVIVNAGYSYEIDYKGVLPTTKRIIVKQDDATVGDDFIVRFKAVGLQPGFAATANLGTMKTSLANLEASTTTGYYRNPTTGDVSVKFVATAKSFTATLTWN